jgi:hypothetical protein
VITPKVTEYTAIAVAENKGAKLDRFECKGAIVEIIVAAKKGKWVWTFVVDNAWAEASKGEGFESHHGAITTAKERACSVVDKNL